MEQKLGRRLRSDEEVHHKDENPTNDEEDNLELLSKAEHTRLHCKDGKRRRLDYDRIRELRLQGLGYKRISNATGYPRSSVRSAIATMNL